MHKLNFYAISFIKQYSVYLFLILLFISHLAFINSDADIDISTYRGPWTDDGFYTGQIKNFVTSNDLTRDKSPGLVITPLFGATFFIPYKIFGTSLHVSRLVVLFLVFLSLIYIANINSYLKSIILLIIPVILLHYYIFHFTHYSMAEILCVMSILLGVVFIYKMLMTDSNKNLNCFLAALFFSCAYFFKIQFVYIIVLFPIFTCFWIIVTRIVDKKLDRYLFYLLKKYLFFILLLGVLYLIAWYLPNKKLYDFVISEVKTWDPFIETDKLNFKGIIIDYLYSVYYHVVLIKELKIFNYVFLISLLIGILLLFSKNSTRNFRILFLLSFTWLLIEMHKFTMVAYLPTRYLISFYFSMGLVIIVTVREGYHLFKLTGIVKKSVFSILFLSTSILIVSNMSFYIASLGRRTYVIKEINDYFKQYDFGNRPIMGNWAPSLSRETKAVSLPIQIGTFNDKKIIETYNPKVVILETEDEHSDGTFKNEILDIDKNTDSVICKKIANKWTIKIRWLK